MSKPIKFTQFLRPHGMPKAITIKRPDEIADLAAACIAKGAVFTVEELMTMQVSLAVEYDDEDVAQEIVANGPEVPEAVDRLVRAAADEILEQ